MKLACADFTWPLLPHDKTLALIGLLDIEAVDLSIFGGRGFFHPDVVRTDIPYYAGLFKERLAHAALELSDVFFQPSADFAEMAPNHPDPAEQERSKALFRDIVTLAQRLGASGMTTLPGVRFGDEPWEASIRRSAEALKWRVDLAAQHGIVLSVEGHIGSNVDTPEKLADLIAWTPGLKLTLDYGHFTYIGIPDDEIEPLLVHARHFHCRGGAKGRLQTTFEENVIDFPRILRKMLAINYPGYYAIEYVYQDWQDCNKCENVSETIKFRDQARAILAEAR